MACSVICTGFEHSLFNLFLTRERHLSYAAIGRAVAWRTASLLVAAAQV